MHFGAGEVARILGMTHQSLGHLSRDLLRDRTPHRHHRYSAAEILWLACYRHARAAGLEAFPAKVFVGGQAMLAMLRALLAEAARDPAEAVKRLHDVPLLYGARYRFAEDDLGDEFLGEPLLIKVQRLPEKLMEPRPTAGVAQLTTFLTPLAPPLNILGRVIRENSNAA